MNLLEGVSIAIESLRGHKLRTFLTLLGNIVGTMSVIAVVSLIYGTDRYVSQVVLDEGTSVFTLTRVDEQGRLWCSDGAGIVVYDTRDGRRTATYPLGLREQAYVTPREPRRAGSGMQV